MRHLTATEAARRFSDVLDAVEHRNESFVIVRNGRPIARLTPTAGRNGAAVADFLSQHHADRRLGDDVRAVRELLRIEDRPWPS